MPGRGAGAKETINKCSVKSRRPVGSLLLVTPDLPQPSIFQAPASGWDLYGGSFSVGLPSLPFLGVGLYHQGAGFQVAGWATL